LVSIHREDCPVHRERAELLSCRIEIKEIDITLERVEKVLGVVLTLQFTADSVDVTGDFRVVIRIGDEQVLLSEPMNIRFFPIDYKYCDETHLTAQCVEKTQISIPG